MQTLPWTTPKPPPTAAGRPVTVVASRLELRRCATSRRSFPVPCGRAPDA